MIAYERRPSSPSGAPRLLGVIFVQYCNPPQKFRQVLQSQSSPCLAVAKANLDHTRYGTGPSLNLLNALMESIQEKGALLYLQPPNYLCSVFIQFMARINLTWVVDQNTAQTLRQSFSRVWRLRDIPGSDLISAAFTGVQPSNGVPNQDNGDMQNICNMLSRQPSYFLFASALDTPVETKDDYVHVEHPAQNQEDLQVLESSITSFLDELGNVHFVNNDDQFLSTLESLNASLRACSKQGPQCQFWQQDLNDQVVPIIVSKILDFKTMIQHNPDIAVRKTPEFQKGLLTVKRYYEMCSVMAQQGAQTEQDQQKCSVGEDIIRAARDVRTTIEQAQDEFKSNCESIDSILHKTPLLSDYTEPGASMWYVPSLHLNDHQKPTSQFSYAKDHADRQGFEASACPFGSLLMGSALLYHRANTNTFSPETFNKLSLLVDQMCCHANILMLKYFTMFQREKEQRTGKRQTLQMSHSSPSDIFSTLASDFSDRRQIVDQWMEWNHLLRHITPYIPQKPGIVAEALRAAGGVYQVPFPQLHWDTLLSALPALCYVGVTWNPYAVGFYKYGPDSYAVFDSHAVNPQTIMQWKPTTQEPLPSRPAAYIMWNMKGQDLYKFLFGRRQGVFASQLSAQQIHEDNAVIPESQTQHFNEMEKMAWFQSRYAMMMEFAIFVRKP